MFVANIAPILIVSEACGLSPQDKGRLIQVAMIVVGVGSLVQMFPIWRVGSRLPIVMGISFTFVSVFCYVGPRYGYGAIIGAVIIGGIVEGLRGFFAKYWRRIIHPDSSGKCRYRYRIFVAFRRCKFLCRRSRCGRLRLVEKLAARRCHAYLLLAF